MTRCLWLILLGALVLALPARAADKAKISYVVPITQYADLLLAADEGYFAAEGIDAELVQAGGGIAVPALIARDLQFIGSPAAAISAILKGAKLKILFVTSYRAAYQLWAQANIRTIEDLKGHAVGVISRGDTTEIAVRYWLTKQGLPSDYVSFTPLGTGTARVATLAAGSYPAAVLGAIETAQLKSTGRLRDQHVLVDFMPIVHMTLSGVATSEALIASNPDLIRRMMRAVLKGIAQVKASRDKTIASIMHHGSEDRAAALVDYDVTLPELTDTGTLPVEDQAFELALRADLLSVPREKVPAASQVYDFSFVEKAAAELKAEHWQPEP